jgi:deoxyribonuclease V
VEQLDALRAEQERLASRVAVLADGALPPEPRVLALYVQYGRNLGHVAGSLWSGEREEGTWVGTLRVEVPYAPGFFCFREGPPLLAFVARLLADGVASPDLLVVDGHGIAHPRRFGVACWVGLATGIPTLGCAKESLLPGAPEPASPRASHAPVHLDGEHVGWSLRSQNGVNPIYASPGHRVSLVEARDAVLALAGRYRIPDPLRRADHAARMHCRGNLAPEDGEDLGVLASAPPAWE